MKKEILYQDKRISYTLTGSGETLVLLHGFGENSQVWKSQVEALRDFRLLIPDLPGSGESEMIDDMSMEGMAAAVKFIMDAENCGKVHLVGHSMGGYISLAFAEKFPESLKGFGLFHSSAYADSPEKVQTRRKGIEFIQKHGAYEFLKTAVPNLYSPFTRENYPSWIEEHLASVRNISGAALVSYYESMIERPDRVHVLKNSQVPVLFILGKYDSAVPLNDGLEQCYLPPLSYIHVLEQSGHMGMIEEHDRSNQILKNFLKGTDHQTQ